MHTASQLTRLRVLVIDDLREMRSTLRAMLAEAQIRDVVMVPDARAAIDAIRAAPFNLILSDYDLGPGTDGQQLLEYLRRERLMPPGGLFFMISAHAAIDRVVSAAEMLPDAYLVKPVNTDQLLMRVEDALTRQVELRGMYEAIHEGRFAEGVAQCQHFERAGSKYMMEILRHRAMCEVALERWDDALVTYRRALERRASMTWSQLGIARCCIAMGDFDVARQRLDAILRERPYHAAAYDLLLELLERIGDMGGAMKVAARAAEHIPSAIRSRRLGEIAYLVDDLDSADTALTRVLKQTSKAITRDFGDRALLSQVCLARGDAQRAMKIVEKGAEDRPNDARVQALVAAVDVQGYTQLGWRAQASDSAVALEGLIDTPADPRSRLLIAKGALTAGLTDAGLRVLGEAVQEAERISSAMSASARALAAKVLVDAGMGERAVAFTGDRAETAVRQAEAAVKTMRSGGFEQAVAMIGEAMPLASGHTGVLTAAVEVYLMTMRVKGVRSDLLEQVRGALVRLRTRGTADPRRLSMMDAYLQKLETGVAATEAAPA